MLEAKKVAWMLERVGRKSPFRAGLRMSLEVRMMIGTMAKMWLKSAWQFEKDWKECLMMGEGSAQKAFRSQER